VSRCRRLTLRTPASPRLAPNHFPSLPLILSESETTPSLPPTHSRSLASESGRSPSLPPSPRASFVLAGYRPPGLSLLASVPESAPSLTPRISESLSAPLAESLGPPEPESPPIPSPSHYPSKYSRLCPSPSLREALRVPGRAGSGAGPRTVTWTVTGRHRSLLLLIGPVAGGGGGGGGGETRR
jgi:hypothetical protein